MGNSPIAPLPCSCIKCEFEGLCAQAPGPFLLLLLLEVELLGFFLPAYFLQPFSTNFVLICWIPFNGQHCTEAFSSQLSLKGGNQN